MSLDIDRLAQLVLPQKQQQQRCFWRCPLIRFSHIHNAIQRPSFSRSHWMRPTTTLIAVLLVVPAVAFAQAGGTPFDTGFTALQTIFTGTIAKVASLIAIVIGGYQFAHGEPGAKKTLAGVAAGTGIAVLATNVLTWLWGV
jgi:type IV secretory pathway VirB2 component (pilin)